MKKLLTLSIFLLGAVFANAQDLQISGTVTQDSFGVPNLPVFIEIHYADSVSVLSATITNQDGSYVYAEPAQSNANGIITVSVPNCLGNIISASVDIVPGLFEYTIDFDFCDNGFGLDTCAVFILEEFAGPGQSLLTAYTGFGIPDTYIWNTGETTQSIQPANSGEYCVTVTQDSCTATACYTYFQDSLDFCFAHIEAHGIPDTNAVFLEVFAVGVPPYSYNWSTGDTASSIPVSEEGTYCVTVTDATGCISESCFDFIFPPDCGVELVCDPPGALNAIPFGVAPYQYVWSTGDSTSVIYPQEEGTYCVTVTDATGCVAEACSPFHPIGSDSCIAAILPFPDTVNSGAFVLSAFGFGFPPLEYLWSTGDTTEFITITDLSVEYCVTITDMSGCEATACILLGNAFCESYVDPVYNQDGTATLTATGIPFNPGSAYVWSTGETGESITVSESGIYCVTVTHQDSCESVSCAEIFIGGGLDSCFSFIIPYTDSTTGSGSVILEAFPVGTGPFTYLWNTGETTPFITVTDLNNAVYCVTITDALGCTSTACVDPIEFNCFGWIELTPDPANSAVVLTAYGAHPLIFGLPDTYIWSTGDTTQSITVQDDTTYCVTMTFLDGCVIEACLDVFLEGDSTLAHGLNGFVLDENGDPVINFEGQVELYSFLNNSEFLTLVDSTHVDSSGFYQFDSVDIGVYLVQAVPDINAPIAESYFPTYHFSAVSWEDALPTFVPNLLTITTDISLVPILETSGNGLISGAIEDADNIMVSLPYLGNNRGDNLDMIQIILWDAQQNPMQMTHTGEDGTFSFADLPYGTYFLSYDVPGIHTAMVEVTIHAEAPHASDILIELGEPGDITSSVENLTEDAFRVWPNPTYDKVYFRTENAGLADARIDVYNGIGNLVQRFSEGVFDLNDQGQIDLTDYPPGMYVIRFSKANQHVTYKVVKQ